MNGIGLIAPVVLVTGRWPHVSLLSLAPAPAVVGFGRALVFGSLFSLVLSDVPHHPAGVGGAVVSAQTVLPLLRDGRGSLLFTGGGLALDPSPEYSSLSVGKAALRSYVHALHKQQQGSEIHVSTVTISGFIGGDDPRFAAAELAATHLNLHRQPQDQWQAELLYA